jgi:type IV pilus assembly protein PilW
MQVLYGEDVNGDGMPERYVTADRVSDHATVVALKVALLIRSLEEVKPIEESINYDLLGTTIRAPNDARLRYVVTSTVKLRNKGKR